MIAYELPNDFPPMRDKCQMDNVVDKCQRVEIFNEHIYEYHAIKLFILGVKFFRGGGD